MMPPFEEGGAYCVVAVCRSVHQQFPFIFFVKDARIEFGILICCHKPGFYIQKVILRGKLFILNNYYSLLISYAGWTFPIQSNESQLNGVKNRDLPLSHNNLVIIPSAD